MNINYSDNTLTIGDLKERIKYLVEVGAVEEPVDEDDGDAWDAHEELKVLQDLEGELHWCWNEDNTTLINGDFWQNYCEETCYSLGDCQPNGIVSNCVNWEKVAEHMSQDYKVLELPESQTFYVRG
jgi:hypothetical protein